MLECKLIELLGNCGAAGIYTAALIILVIKMQNKLFKVIENNTKAMTQLKDSIEKYIVHHKLPS
jgi:hypothetical protein